MERIQRRKMQIETTKTNESEKKTNTSNNTLLTHKFCEMQAKIVAVAPNQDGIHLALNGKWIQCVCVCMGRCVHYAHQIFRRNSFSTPACVYFWVLFQ